MKPASLEFQASWGVFLPQKLFVALITSVKDFVNLVPLEGSSLQSSEFHLFSGIRKFYLFPETYETPSSFQKGMFRLIGNTYTARHSFLLHSLHPLFFNFSWILEGCYICLIIFLHLWPSFGPPLQQQSPAFKSLTDYESPRFTPHCKRKSLSTVESDNSRTVCADKNKCLEGNLTGTSHLFSKTIAVTFLWGPWPPAMAFALVTVPYMSYCPWNKFYIPSKSHE